MLFRSQTIEPFDVQSDKDDSTLLTEDTTTGIPVKYDKTANGIFLSPPPSYTIAKGLKVYINREANYFAYTDTTKKPGVPGLHHRYFAIKPAFAYARRNSLSNVNSLQNEVATLERSIEEYFEIGRASCRERV